MEGETVVFDCVAKGEGTIVTWFREGVPIPELQVQVLSIDLMMYSLNVLGNS